MPARATVIRDFHSAQRQIKIIVYNYELFRGLFALNYLSDSSAGFVHVRIGSENFERIMPRMISSNFLCDKVSNHASGIVTGARILFSRIP